MVSLFIQTNMCDSHTKLDILDNAERPFVSKHTIKLIIVKLGFLFFVSIDEVNLIRVVILKTFDKVIVLFLS